MAMLKNKIKIIVLGLVVLGLNGCNKKEEECLDLYENYTFRIRRASGDSQLVKSLYEEYKFRAEEMGCPVIED